MDTIDLNDPKARDNYFQFKHGRPPDNKIKESIAEMVAFVGPHAEPDDPFLTNDLCLKVRQKYPGQGVYIGHRVKHLWHDKDVPIKRIGTRGTRAVYGLVP